MPAPAGQPQRNPSGPRSRRPHQRRLAQTKAGVTAPPRVPAHSYLDVRLACHRWLLTHDRDYARGYLSGSHPW